MSTRDFLVAIALALVALAGCKTDNCQETPWTRFVSSLSGVSPESGLDCWVSPPVNPPAEPKALGGGDAGASACAPESGDSRCAICMKEACCAEGTACLADPGCAPPGDATFAAATACLADHCTAACGGDR